MSLTILHQSDKWVIAQMSPSTRTLSHSRGEWFRVSFPYLIFAVQILKNHHRGFLFCSKEPISKVIHNVYDFPIPNRASTGGLCMPLMQYPDGALEKIEALVNTYWNSKFSYPLSGGRWGVEEGEKMLERLQEKSRENKEWWKKEKFKELGTLETLMENGGFESDLFSVERCLVTPRQGFFESDWRAENRVPYPNPVIHDEPLPTEKQFITVTQKKPKKSWVQRVLGFLGLRE